MTRTKISSKSKALALLKEFEAATYYLACTNADWRALIRQVGPWHAPAQAGEEPCEALIRAAAYPQLYVKG